MPFNLDPSTPFGERVERRLRNELILWLTTTRADLTPLPTPVWFLWDGQSLLIYSQPDRLKLRNIAKRPRVELNFNGDRYGNDIIVITGDAALDPTAPSAAALPGFSEKYREGISSLGVTPEGFAADYSVALRVTPTELHGH
ncbi:MAG: TIGR03667 family PPOX class F420-dependent oxidoreductase [Chloroflexota bacterium]|nr:TIGR03667 family PPOX class F420-dependent oxidoreductase [Chloroflexota bacterium]